MKTLVLEVRERTLGPDHPNLILPLNNLAKLYIEVNIKRLSRFTKESRRSKKGRFGPDHPDVATVLENMSELYKKMGRQDEAKKVKARAEEIRSNFTKN